MSAMRDGDFARAWEISDEVMRERQLKDEDCSRWPRHLQYIWNGAPLDGKRVLVRCYHGLGDTIQFARLLEALRQRAREVILWVQPELLQLLSAIRGVDRLMPLHDGAPNVEFDVDIEVMELAHALRVDARNLAVRMPYILIGSKTHSSLRSHSGAFNVGIAWRSGRWDTRRSIPTAALAQLADVRNVSFYSLQFPEESLPFDAGVLACKDILRMAHAMLALDLVISVDTMTAHLAGALGLPTWILLGASADWRWMDKRSDSPWYPTMRLFRNNGSTWESMLDGVAAELDALANARCTRGHLSAKAATLLCR